MQLPSVPHIPGLTSGLNSIASLAAFVRDRLARRGDAQLALTGPSDPSTIESAGQLAVVIVGAAAPFASTSYARARLLRQMHASGLLSARETEQAEQLLGVAQ
jgi:hypothetical protein